MARNIPILERRFFPEGHDIISEGDPAEHAYIIQSGIVEIYKDKKGKPVKLDEVFKKGLTLVYFYPKADTPGCTKEACAIRDKWEDVQKAGVTVIGVSMDTPEAQKAFKEKFKLPFTLLADTEGAVVKAFGVSTRRVGVPTRQSFLVKEGKVVWHDPDVKPETHLENVLKAVEEIKKKP